MLKACIKTKVSSPGIVWMDGCDYGDLELPDKWRAFSYGEHLNIGEMLRRVFRDTPNLPWYGWIADDCLPKTIGWDRALIEAAGSRRIAYPNDEWQKGVKERDGTPHITSAVCMGGDLVRAMGFWALPEQIQMYIDDVWESVAVPSGLMKYCPGVVVEHHHFANGKRPHDETDTRVFNGVSFPAHDLAIYQSWLKSPDYQRVLKTIKEMQSDNRR
jgi:hypothetical protein